MKANKRLLIAECHITKVLRWIPIVFTVLAQIALALFVISTVASLVFPEVKRFWATCLVVGVGCCGVIALLLQIIYQIMVEVIAVTLKRQIKLILKNIGTNITLKKFHRAGDFVTLYVVECEGNWWQNKPVRRELAVIANAMARAWHYDVRLTLNISGTIGGIAGDFERK